jgi:hypothetical protein
VTFNKPFALGSLRLYNGAGHLLGPPDLLFYSDNFGESLTGSLVVDASHTAFTFVQTTLADQLGGLSDGTFVVSLLSGLNGLTDTAGVPLDASNNTDTVDNLYPTGTTAYTTTFTLNTLTAFDGSGSQVAVSLPAFAQGPGLSVNPQVPYNYDTYFGGIPATMSDGDNASTVSFQVTYNTALLTVTGAQVDPTTLASYPHATFTRTAGPVVSGMETDTFTFKTNDSTVAGKLSTGQPWTLGELLATVPNTPGQTIYQAKQLLPVTNVTTDAGAYLSVVGGAGFQVVAYLGDGSGDGALTSADAGLANSVVMGMPSEYMGFAAYPVVDPAVVADTDAAESVDGGAVAGLALVGAGFAVPTIPAPPKGANVLPTLAPDPDLSLPSQVTARGGVVSVPVMLDNAMPAGSTGLTEATLALTYDPRVLSVTAADVYLGSLPALGTGWTVTSLVDAGSGQLAIELYSLTPIDVSAAGSLVQVDFHSLAGASGPTTVNLVDAVDPNGGPWFTTSVADSQGAMALGTSTAIAGVAGLAENGPSPQQRVDGLFTALGQDALASGELTIVGGRAEDAVAAAAASQGSATLASRSNSREVLLSGPARTAMEQSEAQRAVFAALAQPQSVGASGEELSAGKDADVPADLWWLQYGQG